jgi:hypothetical protein
MKHGQFTPISNKTGFKYRQTQPLYIIYFTVVTCFDLILPYSGHQYKITVDNFNFCWRYSPTRACAASFLRLADLTQWHATVGMTPPDEGSARRWDLYPTTDRIRTRKSQQVVGHWDRNTIVLDCSNNWDLSFTIKPLPAAMSDFVL